MIDGQPVHVTAHAIERYRERIDGRLSWDEAEAAILAAAPAIVLANRFGCRVVRMGNGAGLVLVGTHVVTVLGKRQFSSGLLDKVGGSDD